MVHQKISKVITKRLVELGEMVTLVFALPSTTPVTFPSVGRLGNIKQL